MNEWWSNMHHDASLSFMIYWNYFVNFYSLNSWNSWNSEITSTPKGGSPFRGWTPPWQPKMKVKFRGCQHTGCWICSTVISKPPSKLYVGFKIVMVFSRQPPDSLLDSHLTATRKLSSVFIFRILVFTLVFWIVGSRKFVWAESIFSLDSLLTACWQPELTTFWQPQGVHLLHHSEPGIGFSICRTIKLI